MNFRGIKIFLSTLLALSFLGNAPLYAAKRKKSKSKKSTVKDAAWFNKNFARAKRKYRLQEINDREMWRRLSKLYRALRQGIKANPAELLQTQAYLLHDGKFPILSARYASRALIASENPYDKKMTPSWKLLKRISAKRQIHDILTHLAKNLVEQEKPPQIIGRSWFYFVAESNLLKKEYDKAIKNYEKLQVRDRYYLAARYQLALTYLFEKDNPNKAGLLLKSMLNNDIKSVVGVKERLRRRYKDHANLALGRLQYERQKFYSSAKYFRSVRRTSPFYYDALFEQAWAFFLAGYPNHALGALHAIDSPFFPGRFNPETAILRSIIYYWLCRYDDSKASLAEFIEQYNEPVTNLETWLEQKSLTPEKAFTLFENLVNGVSDKSLGINRSLLEHSTKSSPMIFARERLATVLAESNRLKARGIFGSKKYIRSPEAFLETWVDELTKELGRVFIAELDSLRDHYRDLRSQSNFIYIELLMSEKEQALGKELHAEAKIDQLNLTTKAKGWGKGSVPWKASSKGEYWWDEVGFYVYQIQPMCKSGEAE